MVIQIDFSNLIKKPKNVINVIIIWLAFCLFLHMCVHSSRELKQIYLQISSKLDFSYSRFLPPYSLQYSLPLIPSLIPQYPPFFLHSPSLLPPFSLYSPFLLPLFFLRSPVVPLPPSLLDTIHGLNLIIHLLHFSLHQYSIGGIGLDLSILGSSIHMG